MKIKRLFLLMVSALLMLSLAGCGEVKEDVIVLRVSNWEEYIDLGDWDEDELIDLEDGTEILGVNALYEDFEIWFYETYGKEVHVEYSTFGTNEELYNQLTIGDVYDLVCPSDYMIMKMMREGMVLPFSEEFFDASIEENYYVKGLSPDIARRFNGLTIEGESLGDYAAGYMWGTLGLVYNPEEVSEEEAAHWDLLLNKNYAKRVTIKDSVRDAYFAALGYYSADEIRTESFISDPNYSENLSYMLNRTDAQTVDDIESILTRIKDNVYSFETDSGKADMVTGKVVANEQWSGDAVYTMDQADEDDVELCYSVPEEVTNLWFDGWIMLKEGIGDDPDKQLAAEAFVNYLSMPENAIRNMYYIGYTSTITGGESDLVFQYLDWNYGVDPEEEEDTVVYNVGYLFTDDEDMIDEYSIITTEDQTRRQLFAQYPPQDVMDRSVIMACFDEEDNERINRMWTNVRCFDISSLFD